MARPSPLRNVGSSSAMVDPYENISLTPRTPHSRAGRAEEGFTAEELQAIRQHEYLDPDDQDSQSAPLLSSRTPKELKSIGPLAARASILFWSCVAGFLLILAIVSFKNPGTLEWYMGINSLTAATTPAVSVAPVDPALLISYENYTSFPLQGKEYVHECWKLTDSRMPMGKFWVPMGDVKDTAHTVDSEVCNSTITYLLDGDRGLLADVALIAQVAALARERGRTFLIDDTHWNRGRQALHPTSLFLILTFQRWTDHFEDVRETQPGPQPGCKPPPPEGTDSVSSTRLLLIVSPEYAACPRHARHWVITSGTAKFHMGSMYMDTYEDPYQHSTNRLEPIFGMSRESMVNTIKPSQENVKLIDLARSELIQETSNYVAAHIRRGDMHAESYAHRNEYIPLETIAEAFQTSNAPLAFLASDSPTALAAMASTLEKEQKKEVYYLGRSKHPELRAIASPHEYLQAEWSAYDAESRLRLTRGMIVDFALLSGWGTGRMAEPGWIFCTLNAAACKLSAVALGWEEAFGSMDPKGDGHINQRTARWVELDLKGVIIPQWRAFDLF
ncbi:hypothetical protein CYLTODRAFT_442690 [Cylindrobasidium torrendii FP15055 ss-10]|uniref:Uncharacterized protein n=1 Tax=Cylindrobasidium torrendii FP15055 ss-10 TaxID=1314674 RepID=A0A0D7BG17_9AGAR|nr:hypothetical protein CYLTODRAFT_442690 [Cylindrobasidium torrendii FP15055 ss-10]